MIYKRLVLNWLSRCLRMIKSVFLHPNSNEMNSFLLILSAVMLQLPQSYAKEYSRRIRCVQSKQSNKCSGLTGLKDCPLAIKIISFICCYGIALFPLLFALYLKWYWIVLINTTFALFITPWFARLFTSQTYMPTPLEMLKTIGVCVVLGAILFLLGYVVKSEIVRFIILTVSILYLIGFIKFQSQYRFNCILVAVLESLADRNEYDYLLRLSTAYALIQHYKDAYECLDQYLAINPESSEYEKVITNMNFCVRPLPWSKTLRNHNGSYWHHFGLRRFGAKRYNFLQEEDYNLVNNYISNFRS